LHLFISKNNNLFNCLPNYKMLIVKRETIESKKPYIVVLLVSVCLIAFPTWFSMRPNNLCHCLLIFSISMQVVNTAWHSNKHNIRCKLHEEYFSTNHNLAFSSSKSCFSLVSYYSIKCKKGIEILCRVKQKKHYTCDSWTSFFFFFQFIFINNINYLKSYQPY